MKSTKIFLALLLFLVSFAVIGCTGDETVTLTVWGAEADQVMLQEMIDAFILENEGEAEFAITLGVQSEATAKDTILQDPEAAPDVFAFADDQLDELASNAILQPITDVAIGTRNNAGSVAAATYNDQLYAYPMTADNGYFMFYNSSYFEASEVATMDGMLTIAEAAGKVVSMELTSGWYLYSFFKGAGLNVGYATDGVSNICNWNSSTATYTGVEVSQAILAIVNSGAFASYTSDEFVTQIATGNVIAGVSGTWNAVAAETAWGEDYAAAKLPTFTVDGQQVQMSSFAGYKLIGVSQTSDYVGWAMKLADWLTNEDNQVKRFNDRSMGPSNINAAASADVQTNPAIAALSAQSAYATVQRVGGNFWAPTESFGTILKQGYETTAGDLDAAKLQTLLDTMVTGVTTVVG